MSDKRLQKHGHKMLKGLGGYAPTLGIMGTVLGMISVLAELGGSIEELGASVALAFIATLYGVSTANLVWLPTGDNLEFKSQRRSPRQKHDHRRHPLHPGWGQPPHS